MPTLWEQYKQLPARKRLYFGAAVFTFSLAGLAVESFILPAEKQPEKVITVAAPFSASNSTG
jgi:hypothetical protein